MTEDDTIIKILLFYHEYHSAENISKNRRDNNQPKSIIFEIIIQKPTKGQSRQLPFKLHGTIRFSNPNPVSRFTGTDRNGPKRTGTDRNGPERTETDLRGYRNGLSEYRNGLSGYRNGPKRTYVDTETDSLSTETDSLGTETDRNGPKRTF